VVLQFSVLSYSAEAAPKYEEASVDELPLYISVKPSKLYEGWYRYSVQVNLKHPSASAFNSWSAQLVLKSANGLDYLLTAPLVRVPDSQEKKGAKVIYFGFTLHSSLLKTAWVQLRDNYKMIVYDTKLWTVIKEGDLKE
jgi:hypothetical protein